MASVIATNREWGEATDGTGTQVDTYLINRWRVRINREGLYNVKAYVSKRRPETRDPKEGKEEDEH